MKNRTVITVDGLAGCGKSALSHLLAARLGYAHLSTGMFYRGLGALALQHHVNPADEQAVLKLLAAHRLELALEEAGAVLRIDGAPMNDRLETAEVSEAASLVAQREGVRSALFEAQRGAFPGNSLVAEGRDMGTVVFPDAAVKFFVSADAAVRAERRLQQMLARDDAGRLGDPETIKRQLALEISERDRRDTERAVSPTRPASDAITVDNSGQTLTAVVQTMYDVIAQRGLA